MPPISATASLISFTLDRILDATLKGKSIFDSEEIIDSLRTLFFYEMKSALIVGVEILTICIVIGLLKNLSGSFGKKGVSDIASLTCSIVIIGLAMTNFHTVYEMTADAMATITYTMEILLPILIALLVSMGQVASGTIMSPLLLTAVTVFQAVIKNVILPAIFISAVLSLINCFNRKRLREPAFPFYPPGGAVCRRTDHDTYVGDHCCAGADR